MGISLSGLGSGMDWKSIIEQLNQVEVQQKIKPLQTQKTSFQNKLSAWESLGSKLSALKTAVGDLKDSTDFSVFKPTLSSSSTSVSADSLLSVTAGTGAGKGRYDVVVNKLAKGDYYDTSTTPYASLTDTNLATGTLDINSKGTVDLTGKNLTEIRDAINALNTSSNELGATGVTASILKISDSDYRLLLSSDNVGSTGTTNGNITLTGSTMAFTQKQSAQDAELSVNGATVTRPTNSINDVIPGVTLDLKKEDLATTVTVDIDRDKDAIKAKVQKFVDAYNDVVGYFDQQMSYNAETKKTGGVLFGNTTLKSIKSNIQNTLLNAESSLGTALSGAGISIGSDNKLTLDSTKFSDALDKSFTDTVDLFNQAGTSFDTMLNNVTDSIDGTITVQKKSAQASMDRLDDKVESTQTRIDRSMAMMTKRFISMDTALSQMQSQSSWLAQQFG